MSKINPSKMPFKYKKDLRVNGKRYYKENRGSIRLKQAVYRLSHLGEEQERHRRGNIRKYGISEQEYLKMFEQQKGLCYICKNPSPRIRLHIDHDHESKKIRKLLCENCNRGLGMFKESPRFLRAAIKYIKNHA